MMLTKIVVGVLGLNLMATASMMSSIPGIAANVDMALTANVISQSYNEWRQTGITPEAVFEAVYAYNDPKAWAVLCNKLSDLTDHDLAFFEEEFTHGAHADKLICGPKLVARLTKYWTDGEKELTKKQDASLTEEEQPKLPSIEKEIDTSKGPVFFNGDLKNGEIAITIDDGPHPTRTRRILDTLKKYGVRVTFFAVGEMAKASVDAAKKRNDGVPNLLKQEVNEGHTVGSHSWNHADLPRLGLDNAEHNILRGHDAVMTAAGLETPFFRFPYGARNKPLQNFLQTLKMGTFFWNMDSSDWKLRNPNDLFQNVLHELDSQKGGIILFHDIQEQTAIIFPHLMEELRKRHFTTVVFVPRIEKEKPAPPQP